MNDLTHFNKRSPIFIIILGSLTAIGALSIDMFLPGLPDIRHDFQTTTSNAQLTLSMFMIGLAFGNLFAGPISDSTGRRKPLIIAMIIFTLASLGIVFVHKYLADGCIKISSRSDRWRSSSYFKSYSK